MLHEFLSSNRDELIRRCRSKVSKRDSPPATALELEYGVPLFLDQLVETLRCEQDSPPRRRSTVGFVSLLDEGYTVEQVVHDYGDICQAVTELAMETHVPVGVDEFRTFNRLLDNAISDAVASYGRHRDESQRVLLDTAVEAFAALKVGNLGLRGATGTLLEMTLTKLRDLVDKSLPEMRSSTGTTKPPKP